MSQNVPTNSSRVLNSALAAKIMSVEEATNFIKPGDQIGVSGFTGSGYPKAVPVELAHRISAAHARGEKFDVSVFTGASTGPELDGELARSGGMKLRLPYQSDADVRKKINSGDTDYLDIHLSAVAQLVQYGFLGKLNVAVVEVTAILEDGRLVPSTSVGNNQTWLDQADKVILEVTTFMPASRTRPFVSRFPSLRPASASAPRI
jgi:succinyl-CoA:acetate CoA-transferase